MRPPQAFLHPFSIDRDAGSARLGDVGNHLAADTPDLPFQAAHSGFTGIGADNFLQRRVGEIYLLLAQAILSPLAWDQVALGNGDLFAFCIARYLDDFHPVAQWSWDGIQRIG